MKGFDKWNEIKKALSKVSTIRGFKEREIFYAMIGQNVGFEQNGTGNKFIRPVVILKKLNRYSFYAVPLSSTQKRNRFYFAFTFKDDVESVAILSQVRFMDAKRLLNKIGMISKDDFEQLKEEIKKVMFE